MYPHQIERLTEVLDREKLDALVASSAENVAYIAGFRTLTGAVVPGPRLAVFARTGTALVIPALDVPTAVVDRVDVAVVRCFGAMAAEFPRSGPDADRVHEILRTAASGPADALAGALKAIGAQGGRVGLDESGFTRQGWDAVVGGLGPQPVAAAGLLMGARRVKSPYEIECLEKALVIAEEALNAVLQALKPGMTEREALAVYEAEVSRRGAVPGPSMIVAGERCWLPAAVPGDRATRPGDVLRFDMAAVFRGYHATVARTAVMGEPDSRTQALHEGLQAGIEAAVAAMKPGVPCGEVVEAAQTAARDGGIAGYVVDQIGHGIGLERAEAPSLARGTATALELGEVVTVGLPYLEVGVTGLAVTDTVLVARLGARPMNRSVHGLVALD